MTITDIEKMSVAERLQAMEALWDSLTLQTPKVDAPEWHHSVLEDRRKLIESDSAEFISLDELKSR